MSSDSQNTWGNLSKLTNDILGATRTNDKISSESLQPGNKFFVTFNSNEVYTITGRTLKSDTQNISKPTGMKANLNTIKLALGTVKGLGIWFNSYTGLENLSTSRPQLCIAEGPENALTIRSLGYNFVVSTINASNFGNITIPETVKEILLFPDAGESGKRAADKAAYNYGKVLSNIKVIFPPKNPDNPKWDWNDELMLRGKNVRERGK